MSIQTKTLNHLKKLAEDNNVDFDKETQWANTGTVYFRKGFKTVATLSYNFQSTWDNFTVTLCKGSKVSKGFCSGESDYYYKALIKYTDENAFNRLFDKVVEVIKE